MWDKKDSRWRRRKLDHGTDSIFQKCPDEGVEEIVMGMAHRGRLNVLANVMGKSHEFIFFENFPKISSLMGLMVVAM